MSNKQLFKDIFIYSIYYLTSGFMGFGVFWFYVIFGEINYLGAIFISCIASCVCYALLRGVGTK